MSAQEDFINGVTSCCNGTFTFPAIDMPGLPNFNLAMFGCLFAGVDYVLDFLPPDGGNLPSIPSIDIFIDGFLASIEMPEPYPEFTYGPITIPAAGVGVPAFDISAKLNFVCVCIKFAFDAFGLIIDKLISDLVIEIPSAGDLQILFGDIALDAGLDGISVPIFGGCLATATYNFLTGALT